MKLRILGFVIGGLSLFYFLFYGISTGLTNKFTYFWLLLGLGCILPAIFAKPIRHLVAAMPGILKAIIAAVAAICILVLIVTEAAIIGYGAAEPEPGADYVIVLGAQVRGRTPSYNLARRLDQAYDYLNENPSAQVILSGGQGAGEEISEAQAMAEYLQRKGIAKERMILEDKSVNTFENLQYSREKMENGNAHVVLVTNNFHVFRSVKIAKKQGFTNVEGLGASVMWYTVPNLYLREAFAVVKYALFGQI